MNTAFFSNRPNKHLIHKIEKETEQNVVFQKYCLIFHFPQISLKVYVFQFTKHNDMCLFDLILSKL